MSREAIYRWIEPCVYEYAKTGYRVEQMADCSWDAYLPDAWGIRLKWLGKRIEDGEWMVRYSQPTNV